MLTEAEARTKLCPRMFAASIGVPRAAESAGMTAPAAFPSRRQRRATGQFGRPQYHFGDPR
jgi:hypothetical protein